MQVTDYTPYSTVLPLIKEVPAWLTDEHANRVAAYQKYEEIYWSDERAFRLLQRGSEDRPIYVPNPRTIADTTAHFLLKGATITVDTPDKNKEFDEFLKKFLKREQFYSRLMMNKQAGVTRGDWIFHITADETLPEGDRISLTTVDPGAYFPVYDPDDLDKRIEVHLAEQFIDPEDNQEAVRQLSYWYEGEPGNRKVMREEVVLELDGWGTDREKIKRVILKPKPLPEDITQIPVYHFKNIEWQGDPFGASELRGYERIAAAVNQAISDEEIALALQGLGVYATDAGSPVDENGAETDWEIAPAKVMEVSPGAYFKRVEGVTSVAPSQDHVQYLEERLFESSHTFRSGRVDVGVAESGIALAIQFLPMLAKIEQRDLTGVDKLTNLFYDLKFWFKAYEGQDWLDVDVDVVLGDKLPQNRTERINELNNMLDRKVISRAYYRREVAKLGYEFPDDIEAEIEKEKMADIELQRQTALATASAQELSSGGRPENKSNNKERPNESGGTEAADNQS